MNWSNLAEKVKLHKIVKTKTKQKRIKFNQHLCVFDMSMHKCNQQGHNLFNASSLEQYIRLKCQ